MLVPASFSGVPECGEREEGVHGTHMDAEEASPFVLRPRVGEGGAARFLGDLGALLDAAWDGAAWADVLAN